MPLVSGSHRHRDRERERDRDRQRASSPHRTQQRRRTARLPEYEAPSCPLDNEALKELAQLAKSADTRKYEEQIKHSIQLLTNNVRDINDRFVKRKEELVKLQRQHRNQSEGDDEDGDSRKRLRTEEENVSRLREAVPSLTTDCDNAVREVIDLRVELEDDRQAVQDTARKLEDEKAIENGQKREDVDGLDDDHDIFMRNANRKLLGPLHVWKNEKEKAAADYATRSLQQRYATDNDYIGFKRLWWDSVHSVDGKPIPDASRWFTSNGGDDGDEEGQEEEEDLVVAQERISIYCPLSMAVMEHPYTSKVCKHTFDKKAITMFLSSEPRQTAKCPQTGCGKVVSLKDFYDDQVVLRHIQREQQRLNGEYADSDDDVDAEENDNAASRGSHTRRGRDQGD